MAQPLRATLDEIASTVPISAVQSASIACEIAGRIDRWIRTKRPAGVVVPTLQDITITQSGSIWWWRGRSVDASEVIPAIGGLLGVLLQRTPAGRVPAGLLYVVARATESRHLAPFGDLWELHAALARYSAERRDLAIDALLARYQIARSGLPPLGAESSISDVRRLRRAGGVPLDRIANDTGIPISLLRELEWGVYTHWDLAHAGATLTSYAERAGLDPDAVQHVIVREQELALAESRTTSVEPKPVQPQHAFMPFGVAAALLATLIVATPDDRVAPRLDTPRVAVRETPAPVAPRPMPTSTARASETVTPPRATPVRATPPAPRRTRVAAPNKGTRASRAEQPVKPLLRLARALAGDGRYRVEPFPKPKE